MGLFVPLLSLFAVLHCSILVGKIMRDILYLVLFYTFYKINFIEIVITVSKFEKEFLLFI